MGLGLFATVVTLLVTAVQIQTRQVQAARDQQEALQLAQMAIQTQQDQLTLNGQSVQVDRSAGSLRLYSQGKELIHVYQTP